MKFANGAVEIEIMPIAEGLIDLALSAGLEGPLSFGMLPHDIVETCKKQFDERFPDSDLMIGNEILWRDEVIQMKADIMDAITTEMYRIASDRHILKV
jgi:hypothetical protein